MLVDIIFQGNVNSGPAKSKLEGESEDSIYLQFFKLSEEIPYGSKSYYKFADKLIQKKYELWMKLPSTFNKLIAIK